MDQPAFTDVAFRASTTSATLDAGDNTFDLAASPSANVAQSILTVGPLPMSAAIDYTAVAVGTGTTDVSVLAIVDNRRNIADTQYRLQVTHAASTVGEVDIYEVSDPSTPALLLENVPYQATGSLDVDVGDYVIGIDADDDPSAMEFTYDAALQTLAVPGGAFVNVYANENGASVDLVVQLDDATTLPVAPN